MNGGAGISVSVVEPGFVDTPMQAKGRDEIERMRSELPAQCLAWYGEAIDRLGALLRSALAPPPRKRRPTKPTKGSERRRLKQKRERKQLKKLRRPPTVDD